jgi:hypothetical protein
MTDACANYLYILFAGGRLNCGPSGFQGKHAVVLKSKQRTVTLDRR